MSCTKQLPCDFKVMYNTFSGRQLEKQLGVRLHYFGLNNRRDPYESEDSENPYLPYANVSDGEDNEPIRNWERRPDKWCRMKCCDYIRMDDQFCRAIHQVTVDGQVQDLVCGREAGQGNDPRFGGCSSVWGPGHEDLNEHVRAGYGYYLQVRMQHGGVVNGCRPLSLQAWHELQRRQTDNPSAPEPWNSERNFPTRYLAYKRGRFPHDQNRVVALNTVIGEFLRVHGWAYEQEFEDWQTARAWVIQPLPLNEIYRGFAPQGGHQVRLPPVIFDSL